QYVFHYWIPPCFSLSLVEKNLHIACNLGVFQDRYFCSLQLNLCSALYALHNQVVKFFGFLFGLKDLVRMIWVQSLRPLPRSTRKLALRVPHKFLDSNRIDWFLGEQYRPQCNVLESPEPA